jgi:hypothetical protein
MKAVTVIVVFLIGVFLGAVPVSEVAARGSDMHPHTSLCSP